MKLINKAKEIIESYWSQGAFEIEDEDGKVYYCLLGACGHAYGLINDKNFEPGDVESEFSWMCESFRPELRAIAESIKERDSAYDESVAESTRLWEHQIGEMVDHYADEEPIELTGDYWDEQVIDYIASWNDMQERELDEVLDVMARAEVRLSAVKT